jgi:acyl dehydratase
MTDERKQSLGTMNRRKIVQFAGIVQDFNPVHFDDEFARKAGLPQVIAQGPLTVAIALDALVAQHGPALRSLNMRLKSPVFPGDELTLKATGEGQLQVSCGDRTVISGELSLR